ncbi:MAG: ATP-binding protein [Candidatus Binataceae bacterium]
MPNSTTASSGNEQILFSRLLANLPARVWIKDAQGRYIFVNQTLVSDLNIEHDRWIGSRDEELFPGPGQVYWRKDQQVLSSGETLVTTDQVEDGKFLTVLRFPLDLEGLPHVAGIGLESTQQIIALLGMFQLRDELFRNERLRSIGEMATGLAHDLNNSLNAAVLRLHLIESKVSNELKPEVDALKRSISAASDRVRALREFVNSDQQEKIERVDLQRLIRDSIDMVTLLIEKTPTARGGSIKIDRRIPETLRPIAAPPNQLKHVIANLLINARDAMADGGSILIEARNAHTAVELTISDEGTGIAPDVLERIFEPFFTTKAFGTGLGLSMARDVVTRIGGQIHAANRAPKGTSFILSLPLSEESGNDPGARTF